MENLDFTKELKHKIALEIQTYLTRKNKQCITNYDQLLIDINNLIEVIH